MKTKFSPRLFIATSAIALGIAGAATSALAMPFGGNGPDGGGRSGHHKTTPPLANNTPNNTAK